MSLPSVNFLHLTVSDIARTRFYSSRSLWKDQRSNQGQTMTLNSYTPNQCPYHISTSYTLQFTRYRPKKIFKLKVTMARSKVKSRSDHDIAHLHPLINDPTKYQLPTLYGFRDIPGQNFIGQGHYGKVKSRSDYDVAHLHSLTNVPTKYQLPTPYSFRDIARKRFSNSRPLRQGQRSNQGHTMMLHTYTH